MWNIIIVITWGLLLASLLVWLDLSLLPSFEVVAGFFFFTIFTLGTTLRGGGRLELRSYNNSDSILNKWFTFINDLAHTILFRSVFHHNEIVLRCLLCFRVCLHIPTPSPSKFNIVSMVMGSLTGRMGLEPILPVNHWHNVKLLTGTVTASERVNSPSVL